MICQLWKCFLHNIESFALKIEPEPKDTKNNRNTLSFHYYNFDCQLIKLTKKSYGQSGYGKYFSTKLKKIHLYLLKYLFCSFLLVTSKKIHIFALGLSV